MASVFLTSEARLQFDELRPPMRGRIAAVFERLADWPRVSGAKPLRGSLTGHYRARTGDYHVVFRPEGDRVMVVRISLRRDVYED